MKEKKKKKAGKRKKVRVVPARSAINIRNVAMQFQIGVHSDNLYDKAELNRAPQIVLTFTPTSATGAISNPWGGLIYVTVSVYTFIVIPSPDLF